MAIQEEIEALATNIDSMGSLRSALYLIVCAERVMHLFVDFATAHMPGKEHALIPIVEAIKLFLEGGDVLDWAAALSDVEKVTPHDNDIDDAADARHSCVAVDAALRGCSGDLVGEYAEAMVMPVATAILVRETGCVDLGSCPEQDAFGERVVSEPDVQVELRFQWLLCAEIEAWQPGTVVPWQSLARLVQSFPTSLVLHSDESG